MVLGTAASCGLNNDSNKATIQAIYTTHRQVTSFIGILFVVFMGSVDEMVYGGLVFFSPALHDFFRPLGFGILRRATTMDGESADNAGAIVC